jgi:hypothetical protein
MVVRRARLMPPPCRATKAEIDLLVDFVESGASRGCRNEMERARRYFALLRKRGLRGGTAPRDWELAWGGGEYLEPEDAAGVERMVATHKAEALREHQAELLAAQGATP